jgi:septal ring factor EnvC (AmiA/AmiB activator)
MEIAMILSLAVMGIYFVKSTDLPKELTERRDQSRAQYKSEVKAEFTPKKMSIVTNANNDAKINILMTEIAQLEKELQASTIMSTKIQLNINAKVANLQSLKDVLNS